MPRPKGSKNKKNAKAVTSPSQQIKEQISFIEAEIEKISEDLKARKAKVASLRKDLLVAEAAEARAKVEADKEKLLSAVAASGKSVEEIIQMLK